MNRFFTLLLAASCLTAVGQVTYPYNPDGNADSLIGASDIQDLLSGYGLPFSPSEILVDGQTLTTVLTQLQNSIDSLSGLTGGGGSALDMPLGTVLPIATESVPEGWMLCDGREISIEEYQGLYDLIGTTYGAGDSAFWAQVFYPATTFNIPDLRGRTIIGANDMGGEQSDVLTIHQSSAGQVGGEEMHQLTEAEMPSHSHILGPVLETFVSQGSVQTNYSGNRTNVTYGDSLVTTSSGNDQPHNNMQPYMALNYMMKVQVAEDVVTTLQSEIDSLESALEALANSQPPTFEMECVGGGVASNCFGQVSPSQFSSNNYYDYPISPYCNTQYTDDFVSPTWRLFKVSGLPQSIESTQIGFRYWETSNYLDSEFRVSYGHEVVVEDGEFQFVLFASTVNSLYEGLWPDGVPSIQADYNYAGGSNSAGTRSHFELLVVIDGRYLDTGIRFNP